MDAKKLRELHAGPTYHLVRDCGPFERELGVTLPADFKDLLAHFGFGDFGELMLFHPACGVESLKLPEGPLHAHAVLHEYKEDFGFDLGPQPGPAGVVLGMIGPRRYLIWDATSRTWKVLDTEMVTSTGPR